MDLFCLPIEIWAGLSCSDRCKPSGGVTSQLSPFSLCLLFSLHVYEAMMYECFLQRRLFYCNSFLFLFSRVDPYAWRWPLFLIIFLTSALRILAVDWIMARNAWLKFKSILFSFANYSWLALKLYYIQEIASYLKEKKIMIEFLGWNLKIENSWKCSHIPAP